jgi:hypothetical protein
MSEEQVPHAPSTRLTVPAILCDDRAKQYQLRPIPGQLPLFPVPLPNPTEK